MPKRDKYWLKSFVSRICDQIEEYRGKPPNYIEVQGIIQRFIKNNPDADPEAIDWVSHYDPRLEYSEILQRLKEAYPQYRWEEEEVKRREYDEERYFSELLDYLRRQAEELPRELRLRFVRELASELDIPLERVREIEERIVERPPEEGAKREVVVDLTLMAKYPPLPEAKQFISAFDFDDVEDAVYERACERVIEAAEKAMTSVKLDDPLTELLSYPVATAIVSYFANKWLINRFALAEGRRVEKLLMVDEPEVLEFVAKKCLKTLQRIEDEYDPLRRYGDYKLNFAEYLKITTRVGLNREPRWKLNNKPVHRGFVALTPAEVARMVRAYAQIAVRNVASRAVQGRGRLPERVRMAAEGIRPRLGEIISRLRKEITGIPEEMPPCMKLIQQRIIAGEDVSHFENFAIAAYLLNTGKTVEDVLALFSHRSDFNERIARYQVEHIAGLRGSRTKYRPPSCSKMKTLGLCVEGGKHCPRNIRNPLDYRPRRKQSNPSYIT